MLISVNYNLFITIITPTTRSDVATTLDLLVEFATGRESDLNCYDKEPDVDSNDIGGTRSASCMFNHTLKEIVLLNFR